MGGFGSTLNNFRQSFQPQQWASNVMQKSRQSMMNMGSGGFGFGGSRPDNQGFNQMGGPQKGAMMGGPMPGQNGNFPSNSSSSSGGMSNPGGQMGMNGYGRGPANPYGGGAPGPYGAGPAPNAGFSPNGGFSPQQGGFSQGQGQYPPHNYAPNAYPRNNFS